MCVYMGGEGCGGAFSSVWKLSGSQRSDSFSGLDHVALWVNVTEGQ